VEAQHRRGDARGVAGVSPQSNGSVYIGVPVPGLVTVQPHTGRLGVPPRWLHETAGAPVVVPESASEVLPESPWLHSDAHCVAHAVQTHSAAALYSSIAVAPAVEPH
jgi:hypothetical protein